MKNVTGLFDFVKGQTVVGEGIDVAGRQLKLLKLLKAEVNGHALLFFVLGSFFGFYLKGWTESTIRTNTVESDAAIIQKAVGSDALVIVHVEQLGPGLGTDGYVSYEAMVEKGSESDLISHGYKRVAKMI